MACRHAHRRARRLHHVFLVFDRDVQSDRTGRAGARAVERVAERGAMPRRDLARRGLGKTTMKHSDVLMVRIYLTEGEHLLKQLMKKLHDEEKVRGVTVFRGISGFGRSGKMHSASLVDLSLDLPLVLEFFDE